MRKLLAVLITILTILFIYLLYSRKSYNESFEDIQWTADTELVIVSSHYGEDLTWLTKAPAPVIVCGKEGEKDAAITSHPKCKTINEGNEASSYLKFIIEFYDNLPKNVLFIHGHESAWHQHSNIFDVITEKKYANDKGYYSVNADKLRPGPEGQCANAFCNVKIAAIWDTYFKPYLKREYPKKLKVECCAQFVISREMILRNPKEAYMHWYKLLTEDFKNYPDICPKSKDMAVIFEYIWHIIFGQPDEIDE